MSNKMIMFFRHIKNVASSMRVTLKGMLIDS